MLFITCFLRDAQSESNHVLWTFVFLFFFASLRDWVQISFMISVNCSVAKFTLSLSVVKVVVSNWDRRQRKSSRFRTFINFSFESSFQMNCFGRLNVCTWGSKNGGADAVAEMVAQQMSWGWSEKIVGSLTTRFSHMFINSWLTMK